MLNVGDRFWFGSDYVGEVISLDDAGPEGCFVRLPSGYVSRWSRYVDENEPACVRVERVEIANGQ